MIAPATLPMVNVPTSVMSPRLTGIAVVLRFTVAFGARSGSKMFSATVVATWLSVDMGTGAALNPNPNCGIVCCAVTGRGCGADARRSFLTDVATSASTAGSLSHSYPWNVTNAARIRLAQIRMVLISRSPS